MKLYQKGSAAIVVIIVLALVALGGGGYYVYTQNQKDKDSSGSPSAEQVTVNEETGITEIKPPYTIKITVTDSANPESDGTIEIAYESDTAWKMTSSAAGGAGQFLLVDGYFYTSQDGATWIRYPYDTSTATDVGSYSFSADELAMYENNGKLIGEESCGTGKCRVIEVSNVAGVDNSTIYVDTKTGALVRVISTTGTATYDMSYDFTTPVDVVAPATYQDLGL